MVDSDSCVLKTEPLRKGTTPGWGNGSTVSSKDNDWAGLDQVEQHLREVLTAAP